MNHPPQHQDQAAVPISTASPNLAVEQFIRQGRAAAYLLQHGIDATGDGRDVVTIATIHGFVADTPPSALAHLSVEEKSAVC